MDFQVVLYTQNSSTTSKISSSRHGIKYTGQWKGDKRDGHGLQESHGSASSFMLFMAQLASVSFGRSGPMVPASMALIQVAQVWQKEDALTAEFACQVSGEMA